MSTEPPIAAEISVAGALFFAEERGERDVARVERALRPLLARLSPADPRVDFRELDPYDEIRIYAARFDMVLVCTDARHYLLTSGLKGSKEEHLALYDAISAALKEAGVWHEIEMMEKVADGAWEDLVWIEWAGGERVIRWAEPREG